MIILVTGWRYCRSGQYVVAMLDRVMNSFALPSEPIELVHGQCPLGGVDEYAEAWGTIRCWPREPTRFPAERYGKWPECGSIRNEAMVRYFDQHEDLNKVAVAFPEVGWEMRARCGTRNCIETLRKLGHSPIIYEVTR